MLYLYRYYKTIRVMAWLFQQDTDFLKIVFEILQTEIETRSKR